MYIMTNNKQPILSDDHSLYERFNIVMYSVVINTTMTTKDSKSSIQRHKVSTRLGMRTLIEPYKFKESDYYSMNLRGFAIDNGAWTAFNKKQDFPTEKFINMVTKVGNYADWIAIPDCVGDRLGTLAKANNWIDKIRNITNRPLLIVYQDNMTRQDLLPYVRDGIGVFIGGSTEAKLNALEMVGDLCKEYNVWSHCGRVSSPLRMEMCISNGIKSIDGSGWNRFLYLCQYAYDYLTIKGGQIELFPSAQQNFSILTTFEERNKFFNIPIEEYDKMANINTDDIGIKHDRKKDYSVLRWDR